MPGFFIMAFSVVRGTPRRQHFFKIVVWRRVEKISSGTVPDHTDGIPSTVSDQAVIRIFKAEG
jgi:hypothetical protein